MTSDGNGTTLPTGFLMYENPTYGISMQYPSDWKIKNTIISKSNNSTTQPLCNLDAIPSNSRYWKKSQIKSIVSLKIYRH
jgi:hypothetical protein